MAFSKREWSIAAVAFLVPVIGALSAVAYEKTHNAPPSPTPVAADAPGVTVPQTTVGDVQAMAPAERAAFMRGYFAASAAFGVGNPACAVPWFFDQGGGDQVDKSLVDLNAQSKTHPMATALQLAVFNHCANLK